MSKIIGIDLGTTNSAFAYMVAGKPEVITNSEGDRTTPSVVAVTKKGDRLVGKVAQRQRVTNPKNTIYGIKRLIGRKFSDKEVQKDLDIMPYKIVEKGNGVAVEMDEKKYTPEQISAMVLSKIKADAEAFLGEKVTEAIITVPAYFDDFVGHDVEVFLDFFVFKLAADKTLDAVNGVFRVSDALTLSDFAHEAVALFGDGNDGRSGAVALTVGDDLRFARDHVGEGRVGSS